MESIVYRFDELVKLVIPVIDFAKVVGCCISKSVYVFLIGLKNHT